MRFEPDQQEFSEEKLRPAALWQAETGELFKYLVNAFTGRTRVPARLVFECTHALPGEVKIALYRIAQEALNNIASLLVTVAYHLGYPEYRAANGVMGPSIGNGVMSFAYILTNNPISAVFSHIAMHTAGVLQGPATVIQLPPHY